MQTDKTAEANGNVARAQGVRFLATTFRRIHLVVFLIFVFAVVQMFTLWQVCKTGMQTASTVENQGLPALKDLAALQEHLATYRLDSYEYLFAQEAQKTGEAKAADDIAVQMRAELKNIQTLFPEGEGRQLAFNLEKAADVLDAQFLTVRRLVDSDFPAAMKSMDQDIPPRTERVESAANALKEFGYQFSGVQASATFASFGWIKSTAVMFGIANSFVIFCALMFVLLAARRSRVQLSETLARLDERSKELANSQALYQSLVDQMPAGVFRKDMEGRFVFVNSWYCELKGVKMDWFLGKTPLEVATLEAAMPGTKHPVLMSDTEIANQGENDRVLILQSHQIIEREEQYSDVEGKVHYLRVVKSPVFDPDGKITGTQGMLFDITERRRAEETVRRLAAIVENSDEAIIGETLAGIVTSWNHAAEKMFGYTAAEIIGRPLQLIIPPEQQHEEPEILSGFDRGEQVCRFETIRIRKDGQRFDVSATISPIKDANGKIVGASKIVYDITERKRNEESLRLLGSAVEQSTESIVITDAQIDLPGPRIIFINPAYTKMTGYTAAEAIGQTPRILQGAHTDKSVLSRLRKNLEHGEAFHGEAVNYRKDGTEYDQEWQIAPIRDASGTITNFVGVQRDITARKKLQGQLVQSQKMETVGKLAGGIAHEFNSILTAIIGQSELLLNDLPASSPLIKNATEIIKASNRAATLTRQLLAYGRKQFLQPEILDLNRVVTGMGEVLQHLMGVNVVVQMVPAIGLNSVKADAGQLERVIMNLVINARDAMPNGGKLILETANVSFDADSVGRYPELKPGGYVMLAITDTGIGMSDAVKARVFEPFFTTKDVGQVTGLGLSTCYGIVKQSGGHISVYSELGRGTTFKIYLPQIEAQATIPITRLDSPDLPRGAETILLVEDDPALREMAATLLRRLGYTVFAAGNGVEALSLKHEPSTGHIDLLFTDVVMPHMSGKELADRVRALYPHTKILFTSAYTENAIVHQGVLDQGVALLQKPFTPSALANKLREVLDQKKTPED